MRRTDRLFDLIQILRDGKLHTAAELAAGLGVSTRTIWRDMAVMAEAAYAQAFFAGLSQAGGQRDAAYQIAAAKVICAEAALANARSGIQIHGGIGFTAECDAHVFLKRAHLLGQMGGERRWVRETLLSKTGVVA